MRPAAIAIAAVLLAACASPPSKAPAAEPPAASAVGGPSTAAPPVAGPSSAPAPVPVEEEEPVIPPRRIVVPEGKCSGKMLVLGNVLRDCACKSATALGIHKSPVCPGTPKSQAEEIAGLQVTLKAAEPQVKSGAKARVTVRFENKTEQAMPLHFLRDLPLELVFLTEDGKPIPVEGTTSCPASLSEADLAGVTLAPGGEVSVEASVAATKRKYRPGKDACGTTAGTKLAPGKYQVGIADTPLYGKGQTRTASIEVIAK